jgi:hypothetical protein
LSLLGDFLRAGENPAADILKALAIFSLDMITLTKGKQRMTKGSE